MNTGDKAETNQKILSLEIPLLHNYIWTLHKILNMIVKVCKIIIKLSRMFFFFSWVVLINVQIYQIFQILQRFCPRQSVEHAKVLQEEDGLRGTLENARHCFRHFRHVHILQHICEHSSVESRFLILIRFLKWQSLI